MTVDRGAQDGADQLELSSGVPAANEIRTRAKRPEVEFRQQIVTAASALPERRPLWVEKPVNPRQR